ncbi:hypothetical protein KUCAC02_002667 [Chaenocephalus aceratus]|uniref:Uncharacterized protein n=1 Tax=Chaenocephalus aceratus TaxID=36190 RepID=A0ACB9XWU7_CHAAC|nr:hypothetical protein KUCAC02_002667 [Chaenocephalus aceratus]
MFCRLRAARPSVADSSGGRERGGEPHQRCRCVRSNPSPPPCYNTHCRRSGWIYWGICCSWRRRTTAVARLRDSSEPRDPPALPQPPTAGAQRQTAGIQLERQPHSSSVRGHAGLFAQTSCFHITAFRPQRMEEMKAGHRPPPLLPP